MPFGWCNATVTFQRLMAQALTRVTKNYGNLEMCYVDEVVIATPTLEDHIDRRVDQQDPGQECLSGDSGVEEGVQGEQQDLEYKILSWEFRWMSRAHTIDPEEEACSVEDFFIAYNSRNSGIDTCSDKNSSTLSQLSKLAIHTLLVETRARDLDGEVYQDPDSDRYLVPSETVFDNAADDLETIAVSKRSMSRKQIDSRKK